MNRTFCDDANVPCMRHVMWQPLAACACWALETELVVLRDWLFHLLNFICFKFLISIATDGQWLPYWTPQEKTCLAAKNPWWEGTKVWGTRKDFGIPSGHNSVVLQALWKLMDLKMLRLDGSLHLVSRDMYFRLYVSRVVWERRHSLKFPQLILYRIELFIILKNYFGGVDSLYLCCMAALWCSSFQLLCFVQKWKSDIKSWLPYLTRGRIIKVDDYRIIDLKEDVS